MGSDDPLVVERIASQRACECTLTTKIDSLERQLSISKRKLSPAMVHRFGTKLTKRLRGSDANFRRAYVSLLIDRIELSNDAILICGTRSTLKYAMIKDDATPTRDGAQL